MASSYVQFVQCNQDQYTGLEVKDSSALYFVIDKQKIYKGDSLISSINVKFGTDAPSRDNVPAGILYVYQNTSEGNKITLWANNGTDPVQVGGGEATDIADGVITIEKFSPGLVATTLDDSNDQTIPTTKAVVDKITSALAPYDKAFTDVSVSTSEGSHVIKLTAKDGTFKEVTIADIFLSEASYDPVSHELTLTVQNGDPVVVNLEDLVPQSVTASQVAIAREITVTTSVGNLNAGDKVIITGDPQSGEVKAADVQALFEAILSKDKNPTATQPSASVTLSGAGAKEVGTEFTPTFNATLNPGYYQVEGKPQQASGVTATTYAISDTNSNSSSESSGSFAKFTVEEATNYKVNATIGHTAGEMPKTFLGNNYPDVQIKAGSKTASSSTVTGYRNGFYGSLAEKTGEVNSALVRGLTPTNKKVAKGQKYTINVPTGTMRVVLAFDSTIGEVSSITSDEQFGSEIKDSFVKSTVDVEGANGYTAKSYNVYVKDMASAQVTGTKYQVTI